VGTKLDLARAYMDMGDPDGARNILEEVLTEGSAAQKQEAQRLMESLP
jgi:pilus assembly protein FimV